MNKLDTLKEQYKRLGDEIKKLEFQQPVEITLPILPKTLTILAFSEKNMTCQQATDWAKEQGGRLPTKLELQALAESDQIPIDRKWYYWTASSVSDITGSAWYVNLGNGYTDYDGKGNAFYVGALCLR